jgi:hypothetical protein
MNNINIICIGIFFCAFMKYISDFLRKIRFILKMIEILKLMTSTYKHKFTESDKVSAYTFNMNLDY